MKQMNFIFNVMLQPQDISVCTCKCPERQSNLKRFGPKGRQGRWGSLSTSAQSYSAATCFHGCPTGFSNKPRNSKNGSPVRRSGRHFCIINGRVPRTLVEVSFTFLDVLAAVQKRKDPRVNQPWHTRRHLHPKCQGTPDGVHGVRVSNWRGRTRDQNSPKLRMRYTAAATHFQTLLFVDSDSL